MKETDVTEKEPVANRQYKDTIFRMLFSEKQNLLSLYNAVTGRNYANAEDLHIVTLKNAIYMGMKNDLALMLNVNEGHNRELMEQCQILKEYAQYVAKIRNYTTKLNLNDAVECAIKECIAEGILAEFLQENCAEVKMLSILEYDKEWEEEKLRKAEFEAGREEGLEEGMGLAETRIIQNMKKRGDSMQAIAEAIGKPVEQISDLLSQLSRQNA